MLNAEKNFYAVRLLLANECSLRWEAQDAPLRKRVGRSGALRARGARAAEVPRGAHGRSPGLFV